MALRKPCRICGTVTAKGTCPRCTGVIVNAKRPMYDWHERQRRKTQWTTTSRPTGGSAPAGSVRPTPAVTSRQTTSPRWLPVARSLGRSWPYAGVALPPRALVKADRETLCRYELHGLLSE